MGHRHRLAIYITLLVINIFGTISNAIRPDPLLGALCGCVAIVLMTRIALLICRNSDDDEA